MSSCPFLTEITMSFCRAYPVKKLVPSDRLDAGGRCADEAFCCCPVYREAMAKVEAERASKTSNEAPEGRES